MQLFVLHENIRANNTGQNSPMNMLRKTLFTLTLLARQSSLALGAIAESPCVSKRNVYAADIESERSIELTAIMVTKRVVTL
jgi:hypothetical protein